MLQKTSIILRLAIGLAVLGVLLYHTNTNEDLFLLLVESNKFFLVAGFLVFLVHYFFIFLRWKYVLIHVGNNSFTNFEILRSLLGGNSLGLLTPGRLGELARGIFFSRSRFWQISGLSVIDKGYAQIISIFIGVIGLWFLGLEKLGLTPINRILVYIFISSLLIIGAIILTRPQLLSFILKRIVRFLPARWSGYYSQLSENFKRVTRKESFVIAFLSVMINMFSFIEFYVLLHAFIHINFFDTFMAYESAYLTVNFLPFSFSDIGIREGVRIFFFGLVGAGAAAVLNTSLIMFFINSLLPSAIGLLAIPQIKSFSTGKLW